MTPRETGRHGRAGALRLRGLSGRERSHLHHGASEGRISPAPSRIVFAGTPLVVYGVCPADAGAVLNLTFEGTAGPSALEYAVVGASSELGETVRLLRGARLITDLESQFSQATADDSAKARRGADRVSQMLKRTSEEYGLSSQVMSLVAVVKREGDVQGELPKTTVVPVGMPQDTDFESYFAASAMPESMDSGLCRLSIDDPAMDAMRDIAYDEGPELQAEITFAGPDRLIGLSALLEPDGGMPGDNPEERLLASLLALLAFHAEATRVGAAPSPGTSRLLAWLKQADLSTLSEEQRDIVTRVLDANDAKRPVPG